MATDAGSRQDSRKRRWAKRLFGTLVFLGAALAGVYEYQPQRYDLFPREPPANRPWTDPDSKKLFSSGTRIAVITAHPDDAEFYIGGLLTQLGRAGAKISLIVTTDGDKGYYPFSHPEETRRIRRAEQREAAAKWNVAEVIFLAYPDGRFFATPDAVDKIANWLQRIQPEYVLAFDPDYPPRMSHRDHRDAGEAAVRAVQQAGVGKWLLQFSTRAANFAVDVTADWDRKLELLSIHKSQFSGEKLDRISNIVAGSARNYGQMLHVRYAEGLRCIKL